MILTFQSQAHRYPLPRSRTVASVRVVAFNDYSCIVMLQLMMFASLVTILLFIDEVIQCLLFSAHLEFKRSTLFVQAIQYEQHQQFAELFTHECFLGGER